MTLRSHGKFFKTIFRHYLGVGLGKNSFTEGVLDKISKESIIRNK